MPGSLSLTLVLAAVAAMAVPSHTTFTYGYSTSVRHEPSVIPMHIRPHLSYNRSAAASYADQYANTYNYGKFPQFSEDCQNFVSQAESSGTGGVEWFVTVPWPPNRNSSDDRDWYMWEYQTTPPLEWYWSHAWSVVPDNRTFERNSWGDSIASQVYAAPPHNYTFRSWASQGDPVYYDWTSSGSFTHSSIIVTADGNYVDAHTNARYHAYFTLADFNAQWSTTTVEADHIPA